YQLHEVGDVAVDLRHAADDRVADARGHALVRRAEGANVARAGDGDGAQRDGRLSKLNVDARGGGERDHHVVLIDGRVADAAGVRGVRTAGLEALDVVVAGGASERGAREASRFVGNGDLRAVDRFTRGVSDRAGDRSGGHALRREAHWRKKREGASN